MDHTLKSLLEKFSSVCIYLKLMWNLATETSKGYVGLALNLINEIFRKQEILHDTRKMMGNIENLKVRIFYLREFKVQKIKMESNIKC